MEKLVFRVYSANEYFNLQMLWKNQHMNFLLKKPFNFIFVEANVLDI